MTGHGFLKGLIQHTQKLYLQNHVSWLADRLSVKDLLPQVYYQGRRNYSGYV